METNSQRFPFRCRLQWITRTLLAAFIFCPCQNLYSDVIHVGTELVGSGQTVPFFAGGEFQQVYSSSLFATSFEIEELRFFRRSATGGGTIGSVIDRTTYTIGLSVTNKTPGAASANPLSSTFADNITGPETVFFSGLKGGAGDSLGPNDDVLFTGMSPFTYNPTLGNLLVTISKASDPSGGSFGGDLRAAFDNGSTDSTLFSFVSGSTGATMASSTSLGQGLLTQFDGVASASTTPMPEPGSFVLLLLGAITLIPRLRKRSGQEPPPAD